MKIEEKQYEQIKDCFPTQRKPAKISNLNVLNAVLHLVENGCKRRSLPEEYRNWHVIKVHPDGMDALKKADHSPLEECEADGTPSFIWSPHLVGMG